MDAIFAGLIADGGEWPERVVTRLWTPVPSAFGGTRPKAAVEGFVRIYTRQSSMRLLLSKYGLRHDFGEGLLVLSTIGVMLLSIFLVTDSLARRLSILRLVLFGLSISGAALGGLALKSSAKTLAAILVGILLAATFEATVMASALFGWEESELTRRTTTMVFAISAALALMIGWIVYRLRMSHPGSAAGIANDR
jgi:hypothetical protein